MPPTQLLEIEYIKSLYQMA